MKVFARLIYILLAQFFVVTLASADDEPDLRKARTLMILPEVAMTTFAAILASPDQKLTELEWSATFTDRLWTLSLDGRSEDQQIKIVVTGYNWDGDSSGHNQTYSGNGLIGDVPIFVNGRTRWPHGAAHSPTDMKIDNVVKIGRNSFWHWITGAELVGCGLAGGISANILAAGATAGLSAGLSPLIFAKGAVEGAGACASISGMAYVAMTAAQPPNPPQAPPTPAIKEKEPMDDKTIVVARSDGSISGRHFDEMSGVYILKGEHEWDEGIAKGVVFNPGLQ